MTETLELKADRQRLLFASALPQSGISVRAKCGDRVGVIGIEALDRGSLLRWLRSTGGANELAERAVLALLRHGPLADEDAERLPPTVDRDSLLRWLRSTGGANELAERVVLALLGHLFDESEFISGLRIIDNQH